jgi:hypothetical protein
MNDDDNTYNINQILRSYYKLLDMIGDLPGYGPVWYQESGIANILSLSRLHEQGYIISYSSVDGNTFNVIKSDSIE